MNSPDFTGQWLELLAILAGEVLLLAVVLWAIQKGVSTAGWRRTWCQAAVVGVLLIFVAELSGSARVVAVWARSMVRARGQPVGLAAAGEIHEHNQVVQGSTAHGGDSRDSFPLTSTLSPGERERTGAVFRDTDSFRPGPAAFSLTAESPPPFGINRAQAATATETGRRVQGVSAEIHSSLDSRNTVVVVALMLVWVLGSMILGLRAFLARCLFIAFRHRRSPVTSALLLARVYKWARTLAVRRRIRAIESPHLISPIAFGILRPTVGLPQDFLTRFSEVKQEAMLAHEVAHLAAHDPFWCLLADLAVALLWWHPAVWWVRRQLRLASELAADEASLLVTDGPRALSECLVEFGATVLGRPVFGQLRAGGFRSGLGCRVKRLVEIEGCTFPQLNFAKTSLVRILGPMAMAAIVIVCSAWTARRALTDEETMKNTHMKQSLATLALAAIIGGLDATTPTTLAQAPNGPAPFHALGPGGTAGASPVANPGAQDAFDPSAPNARFGNPFQQPRGFMRSGDPERGAQLEAKLREIMLDDVNFDSLPLAEVLRLLRDECTKRDPEKKGINFLINPNGGWNQTGATIDPATGLPVAAGPPSEPVDVGATVIRFNLPLRHVTMRQILDAVVRVADRPLDYSIEDYGVVFSLRPDAGPVQSGGMHLAAAPNRTAVATFRVNTNTFAAGMESAFGIKLGVAGAGGKDGARSRQVQAALRELLAQLGITLEGNKTIFYNELTGVLMIRATPEDLDIVRAAIETLGEGEQSQTGLSYSAPGAFGGGQLPPRRQ